MDAPMPNIPLPPRPARRRRRLRVYSVTAVAGLSMLVTQCAPQQCAPAPAPAPAPSGSVAQQIVSLVNQERAKVGAGPVALHPAISNAAQGQSNYQAAANTMTHAGAGGTDAGDRIAANGYAWRVWGENVASGQPDAASVMQAWMNSDGHRKNILDPRFTDLGVGLAYSAGGVPFWTEDFAVG
jgi:uncharacterized protein YkwD